MVAFKHFSPKMDATIIEIDKILNKKMVFWLLMKKI